MEAEYMNFRFNEEANDEENGSGFCTEGNSPFVPSMEQGVFPKRFCKRWVSLD